MGPGPASSKMAGMISNNRRATTREAQDDTSMMSSSSLMGRDEVVAHMVGEVVIMAMAIGEVATTEEKYISGLD